MPCPPHSSQFYHPHNIGHHLISSNPGLPKPS
jgi:hypothetical protein